MKQEDPTPDIKARLARCFPACVVSLLMMLVGLPGAEIRADVPAQQSSVSNRSATTPPKPQTSTYHPLTKAESTEATLGPRPYQGSFWGLQVHAGLVYRLDAKAGDLPGPMVALSTRIASIMSVADIQLTIQGSMYDVGVNGGDVAIKRLSTGVEARLHPLFMRHLESDNFHLWLAGLYGSLGVDLDITAVNADALLGQRDIDRVEFDVGWHLGAGMDYPLTNVHEGWSLWIGVGYKLRFLSVNTGLKDLTNFNEHTFVITLGYRNNDIFFGRVPQPSEFDYRDPAVPEP